MVAETLPAVMSAEEFSVWALEPDQRDRRWELVRGRVVEVPPPSWCHGTVCFLIAHVLGEYVFRRGAGLVSTNDTGVLVERDPDTLRGADLLLFLEAPRLADLPQYVSEPPNLVVEVVSPSDRVGRTNLRVSQYLRMGVGLVWLVDPEDRTVSVYHAEEPHQVLCESDVLTGNSVLPEFSCQVADLFRLPGQP